MKLVRAPYHFMVSQDMTTSFVSPLVNALEEDAIGIQLNYSGAPVGAIAVQGSLDQINWTSLYVSVNGSVTNTIPIPSDSSPILIDMLTQSIPYIQIAYTAISGTGTMDGFVTGKRLGD
jgi:hypothetical protein